MSLRPHIEEAIRNMPTTQPAKPEDMLKSREIERDVLTPVEQRPKVHKMEDLTVPGPAGDIPIRVYSPEGEGPFPILMFFHGGGFVLQSIETHDELCRYLTLNTGCKVVSVQYRLAPENPFPAAPEDCYAATKWVAENADKIDGDASKLYVSGDSSGGNLAAVVCLMAKDRNGPKIAKQVLIYPITDYHTKDEPSRYPSYEENAIGYGLSNIKMSHYWALYVKDRKEGEHPYASPIRAKDLSGLPPALVITIEKDVLRDEGEAYAKRLEEFGVPVTSKRMEGTIHGYLKTFPKAEESVETFELIANFLKE